MNTMKKQFCLILVLNALLVNHVVAMDNDKFSSGHHRSNSTGSPIPKSPTVKVTITTEESPKRGESSSPIGKTPVSPLPKSESSTGNLNDIDGTTSSPKTFALPKSTSTGDFERILASDQNDLLKELRTLTPIEMRTVQEVSHIVLNITQAQSLKEKSHQSTGLTAAQIAQLEANTNAMVAQMRREDAKATRTLWEKLQEPAVLIQGVSLLLTAAQVLPPLIKFFYTDPNEKAMTDIAVKTAEFKLKQMEKQTKREEAMEMLSLKQIALNQKKEIRKMYAIDRIDELVEKQRDGQTLSEDEEKELAYQRDVVRALAEQSLPAAA
jgi:hypothetical protein